MHFVLIQALFFFLPAYIANMSPVIFEKLGWFKALAIPIDFNFRMGKRELFGPHKTYRGIVAGILGGMLTVLFQIVLYHFFSSSHWIFLFPYESLNLLVLGFLLGFGALFGDLVKSFFKRRLGFKSGSSLFPFDQLDFVFGGLLFGSLYYLLSWEGVLILIIITPLLHFLANVLAYFLKIKAVWW